jgi:hypothetical protein
LIPSGRFLRHFSFALPAFLSEFPTGDDGLLWRRLRYIPLGDEHFVTRFPIYYQRDGESLFDAGNRLITVLERANPQLVSQSPLTWPAARRLALNAGMLLTALGYQLTEVEDLLFHTTERDKRFDEAIRRNPQAKDAVSYFRDFYLMLPRSEQRRLAGTFLDQVFPLTSDPKLRAVFSGSSTPGIAWEEVEANPQLVIINCKGITDPASRRFALHWIVESLSGHLKGRGRRNTPFVVTIDEFANLTAAGSDDNKPLAELFDELLAQYARNNRIFVTIAFQSLDQVDTRLQQTLLRLGTLITGRAGSLREARVIADRLFKKDIYRVQHYRKVWGKVDPPPFIRGYGLVEPVPDARRMSPDYPYYILDAEPEHMSLENQTEDAAGMIQKLGALEFLCRPAISEGAVGEDVVSLALAGAITDPDTGEDIFPDPESDHALIARIQQQLAARSGVPIADILKEQEARLTDGISRKPPQPHTLPAAEVRERQPSRRDERAHPAPSTLKTDPSLPTLDHNEHAFLSHISSHPDTPVSVVYKELGIGAAQGTRLRDSLKAQGLVIELAGRSTSTTGGRPSKCLILTFAGLEVLGVEPPPGRGGSLHRYIQERVVQGALAKGYSATIEQHLETGAIVDVHLAKGAALRIAVEIAIVSTPEREIAHIKSCLASGYDQVYTLFADEKLGARIAADIDKILSPEERGKVWLLPLRQLAYIG